MQSDRHAGERLRLPIAFLPQVSEVNGSQLIPIRSSVTLENLGENLAGDLAIDT